MSFIWSPEALKNFLEHPSTEVQRWAIDKALKLYPDMLCNTVVELLYTVPTKTSWTILRGLAERDMPITNFGPLVEVIQGSAEEEVKALAGAILLRSGYALLPSDVELTSAKIHADIVGLTERGFGLVLEAYRVSGSDNRAILNGIALVCSFADLVRDLARAEDQNEIKKRIDYFRQLWECDIPQLEKLQPVEVLSVLDQALAKQPLKDSTSWKRGLLAELEYDAARLGALRQIAVERVHKWSSEEKGFLLACILCLLRNETCQDRLVKAKDVSGFWTAVVMKPWRGVPGEALRDFLLSVAPHEVLSSLSEALRREYSYASHAFSIVNTLDIPGRFQLFLDVFEGGKYGDILAEEAGEALRRAGAAAIEFIIEYYPRMSKSLGTLVLFVLDSFPTPQVVDFCLKHFEEYMCSSAPEDFVGCLEEIGSSDFLAPLLREWKEGEVGIGRAIKLISEIHGIKDEQIERAIQDTEQKSRHPEDMLEKPISSFPLHCTNCGHTYHYELKKVYLDKGGSPVIGDIIQCKGCGSIETYEVTTRAYFGFTAELMRLVAAREAQPEKGLDSFETPLKIDQRVHMRALGRKVRSISESYRVVKNELEKHPEDASLQRRMGNVLRNGGRSDLALPYYLEAIRLNPKDAESYYSIADILIDQGRYQEAIPYIEQVVLLCREGKMDEDLRRPMFAALLDQVYIVERETGHKVEVFRLAKAEEMAQANETVTLDIRSFDLSKQEDFEWLYHTFRYGRVPQRPVKPDVTLEATRASQVKQSPITRGEKIGRNDPCPCGSGKKYKKCCGR